MSYYEEEINNKPILKIAKELLKKRGYIDCCSILDEGTISVVCTDYDNWNSGTYGYTIYVSLPVSQYSAYIISKTSCAGIQNEMQFNA